MPSLKEMLEEKIEAAVQSGASWWNQSSFGELEINQHIDNDSRNRMLAHRGSLRGSHWLNVGMGDGRGLANTIRNNYQLEEIVGVDLEPERVDATRDYLETIGVVFQPFNGQYIGSYTSPSGHRTTIRLRTANAEHLPFEDNYFDVVESYSVRHLLENFEQGAREDLRVLKPGGVGVMNTTYYREGFENEATGKFNYKWMSKTARTSLKELRMRLYERKEKEAKLGASQVRPLSFFTDTLKKVGFAILDAHQETYNCPAEYYEGISHDKQFHIGLYGEPKNGTPEEKEREMIRVSATSKAVVPFVLEELDNNAPRGYATIVYQKPAA